MKKTILQFLFIIFFYKLVYSQDTNNKNRFIKERDNHNDSTSGYNYNAKLNFLDWILVEGGPRGDFYISKTEVTFMQYDKFCDETGNEKPDDKDWGRGNRPVINVNVSDANKFCEWFNNKTGMQIRLPEENEWEFAAKGGKKSKEFKYSGNNNLNEVGWYEDNSGQKTHEVGTKKPNELDIHDMSGNVWEWVGQNGVRRGGSWSNSDDNCEVSFRFKYFGNIYNRNHVIGFRVLKYK